jgi:hypothetical protein
VRESATDDEIAFRVAINLLRDSVESGRMPNGIALTPEALALHEHTAQHFEALLKRISASG